MNSLIELDSLYLSELARTRVITFVGISNWIVFKYVDRYFVQLIFCSKAVVPTYLCYVINMLVH